MNLKIRENSLFYENKKLGDIVENDIDSDVEYLFESHSHTILNLIKNLKGEELFPNIKFHGLANDIIYGIYLLDDIPILTLCKMINIEDWKYAISPKEFMSNLKLVKIVDNISMEDNSIFIEIKTSFDRKKTIKNIFESILDELDLEINMLMKLNKISSSIEFKSEHLTAGSSILQYFGKLLQEKYPNEKVSVSIKQEGLKVTMLIETPDGKKEEIEEYLNRYGMVVTNQITPQEFTSNPIQVLELETKLNQAEQEIRFQKKLIALQDKTYDENLVSLKDEVNYLRSELSSLRVRNNENMKLLLTSLLKKDKLINKLIKSIENKDDKETKQLLLELKEKDAQGYISLKQHIDNAIIGGLVNAPSWIQFTMEVMKRL